MSKATKQAATEQQPSIAEITVAGFKSLSDEQSIEVRPLTILAGANSSGKSSMMQPLLLLKQTLEASYDAGPLRLSGPNVKFTSADQLLSRIGKGPSLGSFHVGMRLKSGEYFRTSFRKEHKTGFGIEQMEVSWVGGKLTFWPEMTQDEIVATGITKGLDFSKKAPEGYGQGWWAVMRDRCFLGPVWVAKGPDGRSFFAGGRPGAVWEEIIPNVIHVPGLRGNPERFYPQAAVDRNYTGTFEKYTASVISNWEAEKQEATLVELRDSLRQLALTGGVTAHRLNDVQIEVRVGRLPGIPPKGREDWLNIADVGRGVSEALPVVTALLAARPGQLVYLEQPEIHLHPRAQVAMAGALANAANRGVQVVAETHSSLLLLGVQSLVAEGKLSPNKVKLHWFRQNEKSGATTIASADLDEAGRFGDWPEDFDDVTLEAQKSYLDSAQRHLFAE
jgi:AAA domain, putative AbiEii toxin, Type IV TA system